MRLHRVGDVRQCQGTALADWVMQGSDGKDVARGTNVIVFAATGRVESMTGILALADRP